MNPWVIVFLGGTNGTNVVIQGAYPTRDAAEAAIISTGTPWNWQPCQVWGPAIPPPMGTLAPVNCGDGSWLAIASAITPEGGAKPVAYGTFDSLAAAQAWANTQDNPAGYSYGQVFVIA